jgi:hypothetical protein
MWRSFQTFLAEYEYFILPTTQLPPFDVNTPWRVEAPGAIIGVPSSIAPSISGGK